MQAEEGKRDSRWRRLRRFVRSHAGLTVIIVAALLLELLSAAQYYLTRELMEDELEKYAEMELTTKAIITKGIINNSERALKSHIMEIKKNLANPDSLSDIMAWSLKYAPHLKGIGIAFNPGYYKDRDSLFEPYALRTDTGIVCLQIAGERFDYTKDGFYSYIQEKKINSWVDPYKDANLNKKLISYAVPIFDFSGDTIAVYGIDIDTHSLGDTLNYRHIYPSSFVFLLTEEGELIAGPSDSTQEKKVEDAIRVINDRTVKKNLVKDGRVHIAYYYDKEKGDDLSLFYANVKGAPHWQIAVVCYDDEVYGALIELRIRLLLISLLVFVILLFIIGLFARNEEKLEWKTMQEERIAGELRVASQIQQSMLPKSHLQQHDVEIFGSLVPAREVGGDLFDYYIRDEKLFFCIGDVSGKGAPSAMLMGVIHSMFRAFSAHENNPSRIMQTINETSCQGNETNMFVTLFIGVLDLPTGRLRYCNAGHDTPIIIRDSESSSITCNPHLPVGVFDDVVYGMEETTLQPDNTIFLYTDGLTEAKNKERKLFGLENVRNIVATCSGMQPKKIIEIINDEVHKFVGDAEQSDDLTMLVIRYTPKRFESTLEETLLLKNDVHEISRLGIFQKSVYAKLNLAPPLSRQLQLAVEEALVNVIDYAYPVGKEDTIEVRMMSDGQILKIVIMDSGVPFDPTAKEKADTTLPAEERQIGGLGILLVRELMDSINYERNQGKNVLTLVRKISK